MAELLPGMTVPVWGIVSGDHITMPAVDYQPEKSRKSATAFMIEDTICQIGIFFLTGSVFSLGFICLFAVSYWMNHILHCPPSISLATAVTSMTFTCLLV